MYMLLNINLMIREFKTFFRGIRRYQNVHVSILGKWDTELYCDYEHVIDDFCKY